MMTMAVAECVGRDESIDNEMEYEISLSSVSHERLEPLCRRIRSGACTYLPTWEYIKEVAQTGSTSTYT